MFSIHGADREITVPAEVEMAADHWTRDGTLHDSLCQVGDEKSEQLFLQVNDSVEIDLAAAGSVVKRTREVQSVTVLR